MLTPVAEGPLDSWDKRLELIGRVAPFGLLVISVTLQDPSSGLCPGSSRSQRQVRVICPAAIVGPLTNCIFLRL